MITKRLEARYQSGSELASGSNSTLSTARCNSVPPPSSMAGLHLPLDPNSSHPEVETGRSNSTTIQTDLLEHFPESLSGRPLISNGLNVTDVLSLHNDQVRLAQELMSKANHLLETSKDFFTKPPTPVPASVERPPSPLPPALPNFNNTMEFRTTARSPMAQSASFSSHEIPIHSRPSHSHSSEHSSDEDDAHNQSFLPIGLPPMHHRTVRSPPPSMPDESTDDVDVVHIRPLNNLSAFNFDCQQMNAERLNDAEASPRATARRTIFTPEGLHEPTAVSFTSTVASPEDQRARRSTTVMAEHPSSSSSSSASSSPRQPLHSAVQPQHSFTSDSSVIDSHWLHQQQQQRTFETLPYHGHPPPALSDHSVERQVYHRV